MDRYPASRTAASPVSDASGFSAHVLIGGRFCLDEPIGRGTAGYVWRATDLASLEKVAVKIFSAPLGHRPEGHEAIREAAALRAVENPHVVRMISTGTISHPGTGVQTPYLVLELVQGTDLRQNLSGGLPPSDAARLGVELAAGLGGVHAAGYIHRDVKPSNILVDPATGHAKITDLGIAVSSQGVGDKEPSYGSLPYMSPEQVRRAPLTSATDIYSLGLVLLECLTGVRTFDLPQVESMVARTVRGPVIPPALPAGWRSLLSAMTSLSPRERPSAEQCRVELASLQQPAHAAAA
ncbi:serine/threonine-protein kinase [Arthrobacter sp. zg-Y1116]|uniref:serine/threonine-protein kinase n=1 Tax=Arthrobacter sp. zg-Y1116 TaxID=2964611 RepID=UPI002107AFA5|nr:serine/threonine-protein kinase [Arthrobacter sp. zg-Y1116]MCQ1948193.1 serine/threonine protein kinase [Arthrobacter sp. zg-Y1116]